MSNVNTSLSYRSFRAIKIEISRKAGWCKSNLPTNVQDLTTNVLDLPTKTEIIRVGSRPQHPISAGRVSSLYYISPFHSVTLYLLYEVGEIRP